MIIEIYADQMGREGTAGDEFAFITHNKTDFSQEGGDHRQPHADLVPLFDGVSRRSTAAAARRSALEKRSECREMARPARSGR
ncbi:hypothetical protein L2331_17115 [Mesorhizobium muleiense]|nr:hypothetical protein [Mesorhizobium muleiense]